MDISGFLMPDCRYIYREAECTHADMFNTGELQGIYHYDDMCDAGILRVGYIGDTLCVDGRRMSADQYLYIRKLVLQHSWINRILVDDQTYDFTYSRQDFLSTQRYIK